MVMLVICDIVAYVMHGTYKKSLWFGFFGHSVCLFFFFLGQNKKKCPLDELNHLACNCFLDPTEDSRPNQRIARKQYADTFESSQINRK